MINLKDILPMCMCMCMCICNQCYFAQQAVGVCGKENDNNSDKC